MLLFDFCYFLATLLRGVQLYIRTPRAHVDISLSLCLKSLSSMSMSGRARAAVASHVASSHNPHHVKDRGGSHTDCGKKPKINPQSATHGCSHVASTAMGRRVKYGTPVSQNTHCHAPVVSIHSILSQRLSSSGRARSAYGGRSCE